MVLILQKPLKKYPVLFYLIALAFAGLYLYANYLGAAVPLWRYVLIYLQRCSIAMALFMLVMFAGVFSEGSRIRAVLLPLRRELSILGCIFASGHVIAYANTFLPRLLGGGVATEMNLAVSLSISLILTALLVLLTVTSFVAVRRAMKPESWKRVQLLAYPFFGLTYLHLVFVLTPSALAGNSSTILSIAVYTVLFAGYLALRLRKALLERRQPGIVAQAS
jgi:DMSO/TMAO reductase YedYZ heme-binding membrane subunit